MLVRAGTKRRCLKIGTALRFWPMASALVLNATYEPLSVVSARRACVLVLAEQGGHHGCHE